ncbi:hypothetical protein [Flavobacterium daemonense]|uniref:hypothetical protein n=1 Tax=Flavobacterium daemonense TaxID=1393049 RepID=UPI0011865DB9|nr:hypothetical protein [Flavobacterium daemonense]KAF2336488.1 hypothetical protein FND99_04190 [Flavobacterium daemonense]
MKRSYLFLILSILINNYASAQDSNTEYQIFVKRFIENVKDNKKEALADLVVYPLNREYPIPDIIDKADFIKRYDEVFDANFKDEIIKSNPEKNWYDMGLRGTMLDKGSIWLDVDGRLTAVNYLSKFEIDLRKKLIAAQKNDLHESIAYFQTPICILETEKFIIRIDDLGKNNYRFVSWPVGKKMSEKPYMILSSGKLIVEGIGGNHQYEFTNDKYTYECAIIIVGEKNSPPARFTIYQGGKKILIQDAKIVSR